jgi:hypothetical protein
MRHTFEGPGFYRIAVQGQLESGDSDILGGMQIATQENTKDQVPTRVLTGRLLDQSQLVGILNTLYGMHMTILNVETLADVLEQS